MDIRISQKGNDLEISVDYCRIMPGVEFTDTFVIPAAEYTPETKGFVIEAIREESSARDNGLLAYIYYRYLYGERFTEKQVSAIRDNIVYYVGRLADFAETTRHEYGLSPTVAAYKAYLANKKLEESLDSI